MGCDVMAGINVLLSLGLSAGIRRGHQRQAPPPRWWKLARPVLLATRFLAAVLIRVDGAEINDLRKCLLVMKGPYGREQLLGHSVLQGGSPARPAAEWQHESRL